MLPPRILKKQSQSQHRTLSSSGSRLNTMPQPCNNTIPSTSNSSGPSEKVDPGSAVRQVMASTRRARVRALAKINLDLRVLGKRPDGYHELRTIFQTISLSDRLELAFTKQPATEIAVESDLDIPGNLVVQAAQSCLDEMRVAGRLELRLEKRIPMGAGLGGGSSDAAAVLLALPVLAGRAIPIERLMAIARELGS